MQCLFAEPTEWFVPWLPKVLPKVLEIARRHPDRTIFTRFIPPQDPEHASGAWQDYYQRWRSMTRDRIDPHLLELVPPLRKLVPPAKVLNKTVYSAFAHPRLAHSLRRHGVETLIVTGGETDVCVLATVMAAVDLGFCRAAGRCAVQRQRRDPRRLDQALPRALRPADRDDADGTRAPRLGVTAGTGPEVRRCARIDALDGRWAQLRLGDGARDLAGAPNICVQMVQCCDA